MKNKQKFLKFVFSKGEIVHPTCSERVEIEVRERRKTSKRKRKRKKNDSFNLI